MTMKFTSLHCLTVGAFLLFSAAVRAQEPAPAAKPPADVLEANSSVSAPNPDAPATTPAAPGAVVPTNAGAVPDNPAVTPVLTGKKDKIYRGPTDVVVLPATPVLDQEGRQRLDPDDKPMFNAPVRQMRDKKGHPVFDAANKPVFQTAKDLGYDERGKKIPLKKEKEPKTVVVNITFGTFTVDGMTAKAALNYEIKDFKYIYLYVPWIGTTVISNAPFPGSKEARNAFSDKTLTVSVGDHILQLYSDTRLLSKRSESAFVLVDRNFKLPTTNPVVGWGATTRAPFEWPGSKQNKLVAGISAATPPIPENLRPQLLLSPCPAGQMRMAGSKPLPGQVAAVQPCVAISKAIPNTPKDAKAPESTATNNSPSLSSQ